MQTISIIVAGKVQGVWYRQSTKEKAIELGITGNVTNQPDGTVQIIATGTNNQLLQFTDWCKQGPPKAEVIKLVIKEVAFQTFTSFAIEKY